MKKQKLAALVCAAVMVFGAAVPACAETAVAVPTGGSPISTDSDEVRLARVKKYIPLFEFEIVYYDADEKIVTTEKVSSGNWQEGDSHGMKFYDLKHTLALTDAQREKITNAELYMKPKADIPEGLGLLAYAHSTVEYLPGKSPSVVSTGGGGLNTAFSDTCTGKRLVGFVETPEIDESITIHVYDIEEHETKGDGSAETLGKVFDGLRVELAAYDENGKEYIIVSGLVFDEESYYSSARQIYVNIPLPEGHPEYKTYEVRYSSEGDPSLAGKTFHFDGGRLSVVLTHRVADYNGPYESSPREDVDLAIPAGSADSGVVGKGDLFETTSRTWRDEEPGDEITINLLTENYPWNIYVTGQEPAGLPVKLTEGVKKALSGVKLEVKDAAGKTVSSVSADESANAPLEAGKTYTITVSKPGYATRTYDYTMPAKGEPEPLVADLHRYGDLNGDGTVDPQDLGPIISIFKGARTIDKTSYDYAVLDNNQKNGFDTEDLGIFIAYVKGSRAMPK